MIEKLTTVTVGATTYLCELHEHEEGGARLTHAWPMSNSQPLHDWVRRQNMGELQTIQLSASAGYAIAPLDVERTRHLNRLWEDMQEIKRTALLRLENSYFQK